MRTRRVSARDVVAAHLARIEEVDGTLNAVVTRAADRALAEAFEIDQARARGEALGALAGLPLTVKDLIATAGVATVAGHSSRRGIVPEQDAAAVARLRASGAIVLGKSNVPPFGADLQTANAVFGATRNPWDLERTPGGSSGGAAAALAAGMTPVELGSDTAGSLRYPAHCCGVAAHKPTWGIVPLDGHVGPLGDVGTDDDPTVVGPMARNVDDLALLLDVIAGPDERRGRGWRLHLPPPARPEATALTIGVWLDDPACPTGTAVREVLTALVDRIVDAGVRVEEVRPDLDTSAHHELGLQLVQGLVGGGLPDDVVARLRATRTEDTLTGRAAGWMTQSHAAWLRTVARRHEHARAFDAVFDRVDVVLTPVAPIVAPRPDITTTFFRREITVDGATRPFTDLTFWTVAVGSVHLPATVTPAGLAPDGLPVGVQVVGAPFADRTTLLAASLVERLAPPLGLPIDPA